MKRIISVGAAATAVLAVSGTGLAVAASNGQDAQSSGGPAARNPAARAIVSCNGGAQKQTQTTINNAPTTFNEGSVVTLPSTLTVRGPARGLDTLNLTFSAETQLRGSAANDHFDWIQLEVRVDGTPVQPFDGGSPLGFSGSKDYGSHAAQFCTRIGPGRHRVTVVSRLVDNGTNDTLTGWLDDMTLNAVRSE